MQGIFSTTAGIIGEALSTLAASTNRTLTGGTYNLRRARSARPNTDGPRFRARRPVFHPNRQRRSPELVARLQADAADRRERRQLKAWLDAFNRDLGYHPAARQLARERFASREADLLTMARTIQWKLARKVPLTDAEEAAKPATHELRRGMKLPKGWAPAA